MAPDFFTYDNRTGRPPGRALQLIRAVLPGAQAVGDQIGPYADAWQRHNVGALGQAGRRWIVLGDSMSQGIGASSYNHGWVGQLGRQLAAADQRVNIINLSATGARVGDVADQQLPVLEGLGVREDDVVTVFIGYNDLFGGRTLREEMPAAFADLLARLPWGSVVATLPNPGQAVTLTNAHIERWAAAGEIVMADLRVTAPTSWRGKLSADYFHPNDVGYAAIAAAFLPVVRAALARDRVVPADE